jgi:hypothetical protein
MDICEICSMCENMTICVKIWLLLDICVKYAQCVKIWPLVWKIDFHWIFVWSMLNVWKCGYLCENVTFIWYLYEICSMCKNMFIWCLGSLSEVCAVSDGHYTKSSNCSISDEEKGRRICMLLAAACPLAHIHARMCTNGHPTSLMQEAPCAAQTVWNSTRDASRATRCSCPFGHVQHAPQEASCIE